MSTARHPAVLDTIRPGLVVGDTSFVALTDEFVLQAGRRLRLEIYLSAGSGAGTLTFELHTGTIDVSGTRKYKAAKQVAVASPAADTVYLYTLQPEVAGDQAYLPAGFFAVLKWKSDGTATATSPTVAVLDDAS